MAALSAFAAGLPTTGLEILSKALTEVFGEVSLQELGKDNLRYNVRISTKSASVVLVVLDSSSESACKDIEDGLYSSDKYIAYTDDRKLAIVLNERFGLSLEVPEELGEFVPDDLEDPHFADISSLRDEYEARIADYDAILQNLSATIRELEAIIDGEGYSRTVAIDDSSEEIIQLRSTISDLEAKVTTLSDKLSSAEGSYQELKEAMQSLQSQYATLQGNYNAVLQECSDAKLDGSRKSGVIRDKEAAIAELKKKLEAFENTESEYSACMKSVAQLTADIESSKQEVDRLQRSLEARDKEISGLRKDLSTKGSAEKQLKTYSDLLEEERANSSKMAEELSSIRGSNASLSSDIASLTSANQTLEGELSSARDKISKQDILISQLNEKNVELAGRVRVLEGSTNRDANMEEALSELAAVKRELAQLRSNPFIVMYTKAMPRTASRIILFNTMGVRYDNIRFVFSGSSASRKGTYRCLLNEIRKDPSNKYLLVDVVSETCVDYVFEIGRVVNGLKWFTEGGGVHQYITQTVAQNARVLSPGLGYINDSFFLTVCWENRLKELNDSGYKVIVYCGDLSNIVGRVLFENFTDMGTSEIYVQGNSVGSRTILSVSSGISNIRKATVKYFDYDVKMTKFKELMQEKCDCVILNSVGR